MAVITIVGARGGAGSSTLALYLARSLRNRGSRVQLVDEDLWALPDASEFEIADPDHTIVSVCRQEESPWLLRSDHIILVVPAEVRAIANAVKILPTLERSGLCSFVARMPGPTPITPSKIEDLLKVPLAAVIKSEERIATYGEHGSGITKSMKKSLTDLIAYLGLDD